MSILTPQEREALLSLCRGRRRFRTAKTFKALGRARNALKKHGISCGVPEKSVARSSERGQMGVGLNAGGPTHGA